MSEENRSVFRVPIDNFQDSNRLTERLLEVTEPGAVFSKAIKSGDHTVITASEVVVSLGSGFGYGSSDSKAGREQDSIPPATPGGSGGGGGGGGIASARPVAVISVGPEGVQVHPVLDRTKLGIALLSAVGSMLFAIRRMKNQP